MLLAGDNSENVFLNLCIHIAVVINKFSQKKMYEILFIISNAWTGMYEWARMTTTICIVHKKHLI